MKKGILLLMTLFATIGLMAQSHYKVDPAHTSVNFKVKHSGITFVNGRFEKFDGGIIGSLDKMEDARVFFNVEVASINTSVPMRDDHLRSADFFDAENYPAMTFESSRIEKVDDQHYKLQGKLQIRDVTKDATFDVKYGGLVRGENGAETAGFIAKSSINRLDYNVAYDPDGAGIGKEVIITLYLEFKKATL
ncbi:MAG: YceI family protein [Proteiniphilum sp.]|jgi:polyisoprenoid-binding protein YceI|nr:YceI family protein [Proteiniphilum sp.]MDD3555537.1 YceI family protein [Proteiniphilum sp.]MDD4485451.1 YceI family protein [Proteiniphilum sp.]MDY0182029.1 YceI family protein [Proteiniphilum sp.]HHT35123.1 YceI family protein [Bacteroidales bacterium]